MIGENSQLPEIQKLNRHDFDLDLEEQTRLHAIGDAEIKRVGETRSWVFSKLQCKLLF